MAREIGASVVEIVLAARRKTSEYAVRLHPELSAASVSILQRIAKREQVQASQLAAVLDMDKSAVSRQLALLRRIGFVTAEHDPGDRRVRTLKVTPLAEQRMAEIRHQMGDEYYERFHDWSDDELAEFLRLLHRYSAAAHAQTVGSDAAGAAGGTGGAPGAAPTPR